MQTIHDWVDVRARLTRELAAFFEAPNKGTLPLYRYALVDAAQVPDMRGPQFEAEGIEHVSLFTLTREHAITLVAEMFKRLSKKRQILIATQSPYLVDCFELENIIIASASHGETRLRTLPHEQYQAWLDDEYQLSDIWLKHSVGEME